MSEYDNSRAELGYSFFKGVHHFTVHSETFESVEKTENLCTLIRGVMSLGCEEMALFADQLIEMRSALPARLEKVTIMLEEKASRWGDDCGIQMADGEIHVVEGGFAS